MAAGRPRLSLPRCATTASMRPACSTGPSTANASAPMSNSSSFRPSSRATSSSSTTSAPTRQRPYGAIRDVGARLLFLPKYSPDLNPIEQVFAKFKTLLRKVGARTYDAVADASRHPRSIPARRMRRLCEKRRIRVKPNADRSRQAPATIRPIPCFGSRRSRPRQTKRAKVASMRPGAAEV